MLLLQQCFSMTVSHTSDEITHITQYLDCHVSPVAMVTLQLKNVNNSTMNTRVLCTCT